EKIVNMSHLFVKTIGFLGQVRDELQSLKGSRQNQSADGPAASDADGDSRTVGTNLDSLSANTSGDRANQKVLAFLREQMDLLPANGDTEQKKRRQREAGKNPEKFIE
ncbi:hypothetical protein MBANPS3_011627, partial [Mucor bainieri]